MTGVYFPSYLLELFAVDSRRSVADPCTVDRLFWAILKRLANAERESIDFVAQFGCDYTQDELVCGLPLRLAPSVADPANPTNDVAKKMARGSTRNAADWDVVSHEARGAMAAAGPTVAI